MNPASGTGSRLFNRLTVENESKNTPMGRYERKIDCLSENACGLQKYGGCGAFAEPPKDPIKPEIGRLKIGWAESLLFKLFADEILWCKLSGGSDFVKPNA